MEQKLRVSSARGRSDAPWVLLAGFLPDEADEISLAFKKMGWDTLNLRKEAEIEQAFFAHRFDVTAIDAENLEVSAPHLIERLRRARGLSSDATIVAVETCVLGEIQEQLMRSGADLVISRPRDPKLYMINFTRAATLRIQSIGKAV